MLVKIVDLNSIDLTNGKYKVGQSLYSPTLIKSLRKVGQINPVTLISEGDSYVVVNGWKRIEALIELGEKSVYANILNDKEFNQLKLLLLNYFDNKQRYTELDKATLLLKIKDICNFSDEELLPILEILGIKESKNNVRKYLKVASLDDKYSRLYYEEHFTFEQLVMISDIEDREYREVLFNKLFATFRFNNNEMREIIREVYEVSKRDNESFSDCIDNLLKQVGNSRNKNVLKTTLRFMRYPTLVEVEKLFKDKAKSLSSIENLTVKHHPFFETNELELNLKIKDIDHFKETINQLSDADSRRIMESLLSIIREGK